MAPVSMPNSSTEERISELEGYLNTALDVLQDRGFLLELPEQLRNYAFARGNGAEIYATQLRRTFRSAFREQSTWGGELKSDERAELMAEYIPDVEKLASMPNSELHVFNILRDLGKLSVADCDMKFGSGYDDSEPFYEQLDDVFVPAVLKLWKIGPIDSLATAAEDIRLSQKYRADYGLRGYCLRTLQLMKELLTLQATRMKVRKALSSSPLPVELVHQVEEILINDTGVPREEDLDQIW